MGWGVEGLRGWAWRVAELRGEGVLPWKNGAADLCGLLPRSSVWALVRIRTLNVGHIKLGFRNLGNLKLESGQALKLEGLRAPGRLIHQPFPFKAPGTPGPRTSQCFG